MYQIKNKLKREKHIIKRNIKEDYESEKIDPKLT